MKQPPPIKAGDYVKVMSSTLYPQWGRDIIGKVCRVKEVYMFEICGFIGNDISVEQSDRLHFKMDRWRMDTC